MSWTKYTRDHQWIRGESDGGLAVGITAFAAAQLGEIVSVELPQVGSRIEHGDEAVVLESIKSVVEVPMPVSGVIVAANDVLAAEPQLLNEDPAGSGWLFKVRTDVSPAAEWLDEREYLAWVDAARAAE